MIYRVLVCGDRNWTDYQEIQTILLWVQQELGTIEIIEGEARGADLMARTVAKRMGWKFYPFPADWDGLGKKAGPIRNSKMLNEGKPHLVLAFHENLNESKGTKNMVNQAIEAKVPVWTYEDGPNEIFRILSQMKTLFP